MILELTSSLGVIDRVSSLFRAHPALIQGFNTFLPPGYTIQCQVSADKNTITVTTPYGVTTRVQDLSPTPAVVVAAPPPPPAPIPVPVAKPMPPPIVPVPEKDQTPVMEFNHAINYVNKIKNRFTSDPETYKTFLEILQTYQKETRPIQEVYTQVTALFHDAPDLLDEFKAFLPDTTDSSAPAPISAPKKKANAAPSNRDSPSLQKQKPMVEEKKKRAAPGMGERAKAKRAKTSHTLLESPPVAHMNQPKERYQNLEPMQSVYQNPNATQLYGASPLGFPGTPRMQSAYDSYLSNHKTPNLVEAHEFNFFDKVKKYLDDRSTYTEFLKLLNLFTQEIIDIATLLEKSLLFIGGSDELVGNFKELVGWDFVKDGRIKGEDWIIDNEPVLDRPKVELHLMKSFGPSYRKLPDSVRLLTF